MPLPDQARKGLQNTAAVHAFKAITLLRADPAVHAKASQSELYWTCPTRKRCGSYAILCGASVKEAGGGV